jgi:chemotaxis protein CheX
MVDEQSLRDFADNIWTSMLGLSLDAGPSGEGEGHLTGCVAISGGWEGAVTVELSGPLARKVAAALFAMEPDEVGDGEVSDAVGELANMIGGNVKALMPGSCQLSLPSVVQGREDAFEAARGILCASAGLSCEAEPLRVSVFEAAAA